MRGPGSTPSSNRCRPLTIGSGGRCSTPSARARSRKRSMAEQSNVPVRPVAVRHRDPHEQLEVYLLRQPPEGAVAHRRRRLGEGVRLQMVRDDASHLPRDIVTADRLDVQAVEQRGGWRDAGLLVIDGSNAAIEKRGRRRLAEVVAHGAEHDGQLPRAVEVVDPRARLVDDEQRVHPDVSLRVPLRLLRAADERLQLRKEPIDRRRDPARARSRPTAGSRGAAASRFRPRCARLGDRRAGCGGRSLSSPDPSAGRIARRTGFLGARGGCRRRRSADRRRAAGGARADRAGRRTGRDTRRSADPRRSR